MNADLMARGCSAFLSFVAEPALRSLLLGCTAALALWAFRVQRVRTRLLVWTAVLCAALAMPLLGAFVPRVRVAVPAKWMSSLQTRFERGPARAVRNDAAASSAVVRGAETAARASSRAFVASSSAMDRSLRRVMKLGPEGKSTHAAAPKANFLNAATALNEPSRASATDASRTATAIPAPVSSSTPSKSFAIPWAALLLAIYLLGAGILLGRVAIGVWLSARLGRTAHGVEDREALRVLRYRAAFAGLTNPPRLKETAAIAVPATVGVVRAVILLPANWRAWTDEQLDAILAHEISHVARRDALVQLLSLVHRAIFWFSPLGWWLDEQLTDLAEQVSDEAALAGGADRQRYAKTLVGFFAELETAPGRVWWQGVSMAKGSKIGSAERRVGRILAWRGAMSMKKSFAVALIAVAAPIIFAAASVHPFIARAQDKPPAPPKNVVVPGGPAAPVLPKAPQAPGVTAPAIAAPVPAATPLPPSAPSAGIAASAPMTAPLIAGATTPADLSTPPAAVLLPGAPAGAATRIPLEPAIAAPTPEAFAVQDAEAQVQAAKEKLDASQAACRADSSKLIAAKKMLDRLEANSASDASLAIAKQRLDTLEAESKLHDSLMRSAKQKMEAAQKVLREAQALVPGALATVEPIAGYAPSTPVAAVTPMPGFAPSTPMAAVAPNAPLAPQPGYSEGPYGQSSYGDSAGARDQSHMEMTIRNDWTSLSVKVDGAIEFTDDDSDVKSLSPNGHFRLEEGTWLSGRAYDVKADATGNLTKTYSVNGTAKPLDADGHEWLARVLPQVIRESGIGAAARVARFLRQGGPQAVLTEIGLIHSDGSKRIYLEQLFSQAALNPAQLKQAAGLIRGISSDGDKAQVLVAVDKHYLTSELRPYLFDSVRSISSDGDKRIVLSDILQKDAANMETLIDAAVAAKTISSDGDKAQVLIEVGDSYRESDKLRAVYFDAADSIASDGDHAHVLIKLLAAHGSDRGIMARLLRSDARISSDGDKAEVLKEAVPQYSDDPDVQRAFFDAANSIASDSDHQEVLVALVHRQGISSATLAEIARSAQRISSDTDKARVLTELAAGNVEPVRDAFFDAAGSISSDGDRGRVLMAILDKQGVSSAMAIAAIRSATGMSSDGDKGRVLLDAADRYSKNPDVNAALRRAVSSLHSDSEYRAVMSEIARQDGGI